MRSCSKGVATLIDRKGILSLFHSHIKLKTHFKSWSLNDSTILILKFHPRHQRFSSMKGLIQID